MPTWIVQWIAALALIARLMGPPAHEAPAKAPQPVHKPPRAATSTVTGWATYYAYRPAQAAAGPALRRMLGPHWRGMRVRVCTRTACTIVQLTDWCACGPRHGVQTVIDLDLRSFRKIARPWLGVVTVRVSRA